MDLIGRIKKVQLPEVAPADSSPKKHGLQISDQDVHFCYGTSKMTVIDDNCDNFRYFKLKFIEFLEFLARVALISELLVLNEDGSLYTGEEEKKEEFDVESQNSPTRSRVSLPTENDMRVPDKSDVGVSSKTSSAYVVADPHINLNKRPETLKT